MRIALATYEIKDGDIAFNLKQLERGMAEASGKAELVVFGEAFLQGFESMSWDYEKDRHTAVSRDSKIMAEICRLSLKYGIGAAFGYIELDGERIYSSAALIADGKLLKNYRRISPNWKDPYLADEHYCEGETAENFDFRGQKLLFALCGDMWDAPEKFRADDVLIWPIFMCYTPEDWAEDEKAYAEQAQLAAKRALVVGSICRDPNNASCGGTFFFEDGGTKEKAPYGEESVIIVDI